ncbi:hypothetical protein [Streptomyces sp. MA15]|uniref:hypothetical protein n=1 Tax=Streptomyces sp. MA15 TaxID=3055061 RepID=UPI0025AF8248|nr:hypothetical protein [Streptomyces sp. MA15]MDN3272468.1 hypothetical protein [Streptomyces sp. MA15]
MAEPRTGRPDPAARRIASTAGDGARPLADAAAGRRPEAGGQAAHVGPAVTTRSPRRPAAEEHGRGGLIRPRSSDGPVSGSPGRPSVRGVLTARRG